MSGSSGLSSSCSSGLREPPSVQKWHGAQQWGERSRKICEPGEKRVGMKLAKFLLLSPARKSESRAALKQKISGKAE